MGERDAARASRDGTRSNDDGSIDQQFFKPKRVVFETRAKKWGDEERAKLYEGIETYGIQEWADDQGEFAAGLGHAEPEGEGGAV